MPSEDGYPTEEEIKAIQEWDSHRPVMEFVEYIRSLWWAADWGFELRGVKVKWLALHTGGWSGNEEIIEELEKTPFWWMYWQKSRRGGHYLFRIRPREANGLRELKEKEG